jgi:hypothetical protein
VRFRLFCVFSSIFVASVIFAFSKSSSDLSSLVGGQRPGDMVSYTFDAYCGDYLDCYEDSCQGPSTSCASHVDRTDVGAPKTKCFSDPDPENLYFLTCVSWKGSICATLNGTCKWTQIPGTNGYACLMYPLSAPVGVSATPCVTYLPYLP